MAEMVNRPVPEPAVISGLGEVIQDRLADWLAVYRDLHAHPELSGGEERTAGVVAGRFRALGLEVKTGLGGHSVAALMDNGPGPVILLRGDMDALPIEEKTGLDFASRVRKADSTGREVAVMHACGHDIHTTGLIAAAETLHALRRLWQGRVVLVGQPAEEAIGGAQLMLNAGLYEILPRPQAALALHVAPDLPAGTVALRAGASSSGSDNLDLIIRGRSGHGAAPHRTVDPVVLAAQIILALQTVVSRRLDPLEAAVLTVGTIHGGERRNAIPDEVRLELTLRSYDLAVRDKMVAEVERIALGLARAAGLEGELLPSLIQADEFTPPVINDEELTARAREVFNRLLGAENVFEARLKTGSEDFSVFGLVEPPVPYVMFNVGAAEPRLIEDWLAGGEPPPLLHTPWFAPRAEPTLQTAVTCLTGLALSLLDRGEE